MPHLRSNRERTPTYRKKRRSPKRLGFVVFGLLVLLVLIQLAYPSTRTRPFLKINGQYVGFATNERIAELVASSDDQKQTIKLSKQTYETTATEIGVPSDLKQTSGQALEYSWPERLIPFSLFSNGSVNKALEKNIDEAKLKAYTQKLLSENTTAAKNPQIQRSDSGEFMVKPGEDGSTYDAETLERALATIPLPANRDLELSADKKLEPAVSDETANEAAAKAKINEQALQKLIDDWQAKYPSAETAVVFREIGGFGRIADADEGTNFFAASLYKLFIAHYVMSGIQNGTIKADGSIAGTTNSACLRVMITVSDNVCPEAFASRYGWGTIDAFAAKSGFGAANVEYGGNTVNASVTADFLVSLARGELLDQNSTDTLLGYMAKQTYRSAIPAGLPGVTVQDKPGFLGATWHDAAIVRSEKATYVLVVLTEGTGAGAIASLAKQIDALLEPTF